MRPVSRTAWTKSPAHRRHVARLRCRLEMRSQIRMRALIITESGDRMWRLQSHVKAAGYQENKTIYSLCTIARERLTTAAGSFAVTELLAATLHKVAAAGRVSAIAGLAVGHAIADLRDQLARHEHAQFLQ